ncbi:hypothetical protein JW859_10510 [bacterium]|nr:hypothetical protein [bacterium]
MDRRDGLTRAIWLVLVMAALAACGGGGGLSSSEVTINQAAAQSALERFNTYRQLAAVQSVDLEDALSLDCQYHAHYLALNDISLKEVGLSAHGEDPALPGYSVIGAKAGANSIIYQGVTPTEAIDYWMRTFYHRLGVLDPNLYYVGFGSEGEYQVMDVNSGRVKGAAAARGAVVFPAPGMKNVPTQYKREIPHPITDDEELGIPITVEFFGDIGHKINSVGAFVLDLDTSREIKCYRQWPGYPFLKEWDLEQLIALIPEDPLPSGHEFRVSVTATIDDFPWEVEWSFTTD